MKLLAPEHKPIEEEIIEALTENGYAIIDHFLSPDICASILTELHEELSEGQFHKAGVGKADDYQVLHTVRGDYIKWLEPNDLQPFTSIYLEKLGLIRNALNRHCYLGLQDSEFHMTQYPAGTGYMRHVDAFHADDNRRISVVLYLNFDWKTEDDGRLIIYPERGNLSPVEVLPFAGRLALFESTLEHEVTPGGRKRYSITGWLLKEKRFF